MIQLYDKFTLDKADTRRTKDGYLLATPRVARTGIQDYLGAEVGRPDLDKVKVYRPPSEVFSPDSVRSLAHKPITIDHPPVPVTTKNWSKYAKGQTGDAPMKDGEFLRVPMMFADAAAIDAYDSGRRVELSCGYGTELDWTPGVVPDGEPDAGAAYDARQTGIRFNHVALVGSARGGRKLRVGDETLEDEHLDDFNKNHVGAGNPNGGEFASSSGGGSKLKTTAKVVVAAVVLKKLLGSGKLTESKLRSALEEETDMDPDEIDAYISRLDEKGTFDGNSNIIGDNTMAKTFQVDGVSCEATDTSAQVIGRALETRDARIKELEAKAAQDAAALTAATTDAATHKSLVATKDAELVTLKKQVEDSKPTAQQLDQMVAERSAVVVKARQIMGDKLVMDGKSVAEIRRQVVDAQLGDASKGWTDDQVTASYNTIAAAFGDKQPQGRTLPGVTDVAAAFSRPASHQQTTDAVDKAYDEHTRMLREGRSYKPRAA